MLDIQTFDARGGGNVLYKALSHPLAAEAMARLRDRLRPLGPMALVDPDGAGSALLALHPDPPAIQGRYVQDARHLAGDARPLTALAASGARAVLVAAFGAERLARRLAALLPGAAIATLDEVRIPDSLLTVPGRYLDRLNFATNLAFFREQGGLSTRLVSANYWAGYGAGKVRLWLRLFDAGGRALATWEQAMPAGRSGAAGFSIDSAEVRARFGLPEFTGQLFAHAIGAAGHDVVKYALDTYGGPGDASLSCTHDANAWPSARYAGLPAPEENERVVLWLQNSHAAPIPAGAVALGRMGADEATPFPEPVPPFASRALDVSALLPGLRWPAQVELFTGRHVVRPRYEIAREGRIHIAHVNVERADLGPDPGIPALPPELGRGYLLPFPVLPGAEYRTWVLPTPMAERQRTLPLRLDVFAADGRKLGERFLGCLPRGHAIAQDMDAFGPGVAHAELAYDFRDGGEADGWMHALIRARHRESGHTAETSFGAHVFNTLMTYRDEPQSYSGPPPGLTTRLFLKLGDALGGRICRSFAQLIYPASGPWAAYSTTTLVLHDGEGRPIAERQLAIACSGSAMVFPHERFGESLLAQAGPRGHVLIRDATCRLFGYHGLMRDDGGFSLDHMFGF